MTPHRGAPKDAGIETVRRIVLMCRACVSPLIAHPSLFDQPQGFAGLQLQPSRRGFMAMSTAALLGSSLPLVGLHAVAALVMGRIERTRLVKAMVTGTKERY